MTDRDPIAAALEDLRKKEAAEPVQPPAIPNLNTAAYREWYVFETTGPVSITFDPKKLGEAVLTKELCDYGTAGEVLQRQGLIPLSAAVLDWLIQPEHQKYIPENWKDGRERAFAGTVYRDTSYRGVRTLFWSPREGSWHQSIRSTWEGINSRISQILFPYLTP